jgi:hypothetical protein
MQKLPEGEPRNVEESIERLIHQLNPFLNEHETQTANTLIEPASPCEVECIPPNQGLGPVILYLNHVRYRHSAM